jgi:transmembrane sensor
MNYAEAAMEITQRTREQIEAEAADWFLRLQNTSASGADRQSFSEWLLRSPAHVEEYLRVSCAWSLAHVGAEGALETAALVAEAKKSHATDNVVPLPARFGRRSRAAGSGPRFFVRRWSALAACLLAGMAVWVIYVGRHAPLTFQTVVGEQRSFVLQDGSIVFLNTNSKVRVAWQPTQRYIELVRGEARFKVAKDASRPFIVATTTAAVRAVGTVFNVRDESLSTQVAVLEGQVDVTKEASAAIPSAASVRLGAGERAAVSSRGIQTNTGPAIESVMAWPERRLVFRDQALDVVVQEFNRYRTYPLVLDDPTLAALRISGVFDLNDTESLVAYLGTYETVRVARNSDGSQHLFRSPAGIDPKK